MARGGDLLVGHSPGVSRCRFNARSGRSPPWPRSWELVLHVSQESGCIDLAIDPNNPRFLYAAIWDIHINAWGLNSGGPDSGVWHTTDGGDTWERVSSMGHGMPATDGQEIGKIALEVAPSDPDRVYVLTEEDAPRLYRSDNYGRTVDGGRTLVTPRGHGPCRPASRSSRS